ncbi:response regulator [Aquibacillus halophilus]|uniref:Response regulator n=1 Tax=Aquibacillus halophilus TaxID=930132 RepID=A0A6A8DB75_9BACI|nr:response regulator transcription factor [Aquibacillus halophilus]MRH41099.1 response regulator [Aquibacillus halophilus]
MASERILIVDDDADMRDVLELFLKKNGYTVFTAEDGLQAIDIVDNIAPELIILDVMMPNLDGFELCQIIRKKTEVPILFFSSKDEDMDKILGLGVGGDDYIPKSTSMPVIVAKVKAHLRRIRVHQQVLPIIAQPDTLITYPGLVIKLDNAVVIANDSTVKLSAKEYHLLCLMARNPERVYSVEQLFELIWGENSLGDYRTVMVHISNIRKKIELNPENPKYIQTLRGIGYKFNGFKDNRFLF